MVSRRGALRTSALATLGLPFLASRKGEAGFSKMALNGNIKHSVCHWCYQDVPLDEFCEFAKEIGIKSIDLMGVDQWPVLDKYGLYCAMPSGASISLEDGFNDPSLHEKLAKNYSTYIPKVAAAGYDKLICFSGNRRGKTDDEGLANCVEGLKRVLDSAEKYNVTLVMELLNSKVDHPDQQCDHTAWGVRLCKTLGSERFKLLYDIYHMQIMEGDVIRTIQDSHQYIAHYHTGGVPGRNEIDQTQELHYPAIMKAIVETGFKGYVAQEFIPKNNWKDSLADSIKICDV